MHTFTLRTTQAIFFTPSAYNLHLQIEYVIDSALNQDAVEYQLSVRAPLKALIWGAVIGSVMGALAPRHMGKRGLSLLIQQPSPSALIAWLIALLGSILLGILLVIAFARKKDTQPLISVEDFWGGDLHRFLSGISGAGTFGPSHKTRFTGHSAFDSQTMKKFRHLPVRVMRETR